MRITRLGEGVDATGTPGAGGDRPHRRACCASTAAVMDALGVAAVRMTATSAARDAANRDEFMAAPPRPSWDRDPRC